MNCNIKGNLRHNLHVENSQLNSLVDLLINLLFESFKMNKLFCFVIEKIGAYIVFNLSSFL